MADRLDVLSGLIGEGRDKKARIEEGVYEEGRNVGKQEGKRTSYRLTSWRLFLLPLRMSLA